MIYALACSTTYPVAVIVTSLFRAGILTQETIVVDIAIIGVLVIPGRGANFEKPGRLQKHGRLKTWTIFCAEKTWTIRTK